MRVLVCGGRYYSDAAALNAVLDRFHAAHGVTCVIQGGAKGADALAYRWAVSRQVMAHHVPADWKQHGRAAGPIRNAQMLRDFRPEIVIAFPGGQGTADMVRRAKSAGVRVEEVT